MSRRKNKNKQIVQGENMSLNETDVFAAAETQETVVAAATETTEEVVVEETVQEQEPVTTAVVDEEPKKDMVETAKEILKEIGPVETTPITPELDKKIEASIPTMGPITKLQEESFSSMIARKLKERVDYINSRVTLSKAEVETTNIEFTSLVIKIHDSNDTKAYEAYLEHMIKHGDNIPNIVYVMDNILKSGLRLRKSVSMMQSAFEIIVIAVKKNKLPVMNIDPIKIEIYNKNVVNFIISKLS